MRLSLSMRLVLSGSFLRNESAYLENSMSLSISLLWMVTMRSFLASIRSG